MRFCSACAFVSGRLGRRGGNFVLMRTSAVRALSFLVVWAGGGGNFVVMCASAVHVLSFLVVWAVGAGTLS